MPSDVPPELRKFAALFNQGRFWESHEVLEGPWRELRSEFYQGLILVASAYVHVQRGNAHGVAAQLEKAERALEAYRPAYLGVDVDELLRLGRSARSRVRAERDRRPNAWSERIPAPTIALDQRRIRGDEPELRG